VINPDYFDLLKPGDLQQNVFLDTGGDILNWQCEKDGMPYDCNNLENDIRAGTVVGQATDRGVTKQYELGSLIRVGNTIRIEVAGYFTTNWEDFGDGNGLQPVPNSHAGRDYFIEVAVDDNQQSGPGGGGGKGGDKLNTERMANKFDIKTLAKCINDVFGGQVNGLVLAWDRNKGGNFSFNLIAHNGPSTSFSVGPLSSRTLINRSSEELADISSTKANPLTNQSGYTAADNPRDNWIASDVANNSKYKDNAVYALFIHETGNQIANIIQGLHGIEDRNKDWWRNYGNENANFYGVNDPDIGQKLENCVFGGRVGLQTGRLGPNREL
jgi:hypothetical protein